MVATRLVNVVALALALAGSACSDRAARNDRPAPVLPPPRPRTDPNAPAEAPPSPILEREPEVTVTRVNPTLGPVGQWVYVFGSGFVPGQTAVEVGGAPAVAASVYDARQLGFTIPDGARGAGPVTVIVPGARATSRDSYTVGIPSDPPQISRFEPTEGAAGTWVMLYGSNFVTGQTTVIVDGVEAEGHGYGPDSLWFTVPTGVLHSSVVTIRTPNGAATTTTPFDVLAPR